MDSILEEKKSKESSPVTFNLHPHSPVPTTPGGSSYPPYNAARMSAAHQSTMEHRAHSTLTDLPNIPSKHMMNARKSAFKRARSRSKIHHTPTDSAFTPRVAVGGAATDAREADSDHYTPDWFKMSIRTVDRNNAINADVE